jgi:hypothetical protein
MDRDVLCFEGIAPKRTPLDEREEEVARETIRILEDAVEAPELVLPMEECETDAAPAPWKGRYQKRSLILGRTRIDVVSCIRPPEDEDEARAWITRLARETLEASVSKEAPIGCSAEAVMIAEDLYASIEGTEAAPNPTTGTGLTHASALGPSQIAIHCVGLIVAARRETTIDIVEPAPITVTVQYEDLFERPCSHLLIYPSTQALGPLSLDPMERMRAMLARSRSR